jgi:hypothetical protein
MLGWRQTEHAMVASSTQPARIGARVSIWDRFIGATEKQLTVRCGCALWQSLTDQPMRGPEFLSFPISEKLNLNCANLQPSWEPATSNTDGGSELPCQSDPRHPFHAPQGVPTMLARTCLRSARAFTGAKNGAVQITKASLFVHGTGRARAHRMAAWTTTPARPIAPAAPPCPLNPPRTHVLSSPGS